LVPMEPGTVKLRPLAELLAQSNNGAPPPQPFVDAPATWREARGLFSFAYPGTWHTDAPFLARMQALMPGFAASLTDPATATRVEAMVFNGPGANANAILPLVGDAYEKAGVALSFGQPVEFDTGTVKAMAYTMSIANSSNNGVLLLFEIAGDGVGALLIGGPQEHADAVQAQLGGLITSLRTSLTGGVP